MLTGSSAIKYSNNLVGKEYKGDDDVRDPKGEALGDSKEDKPSSKDSSSVRKVRIRKPRRP